MDWTTIQATHGRWLKGVLWARGRDPGAVEELLQEVLWACVREHRVNPIAPAALPRWLYLAAVRKGLEHRRRLGRRRRMENRLAATSTRALEETPLDWLISSERRQLVRTALARLPARDADLLLQKYGDGATAGDIAQRTNLSVTVVEARLHRARERLRQLLRVDQLMESLHD